MNIRYMKNKLYDAANYISQRKDQVIKYTRKGAYAGLCVGLLTNAVYSIVSIAFQAKSIKTLFCKDKVFPAIDNFIGPVNLSLKTDVTTAILKATVLPFVALGCVLGESMFEVYDIQYVGGITLAGATFGFIHAVIKREVQFEQDVKIEKQTKSMNQRLNAIGFDTSEAPDRFVCPITYEIMNEPAFIPDGYTYEREAILEWYGRKKISPMTNLPFPRWSMDTNQVLKSEIKEYVEKAEREYWSYVGTFFNTKLAENVKPNNAVNIIKAYTL